MIENIAHSSSEVANKLKETKDYVPSFMDKMELPKTSEKVDIFEPVADKHKCEFSEYQMDVLSKDYGYSLEQIEGLTSWEDVENEQFDIDDDVQDVVDDELFDELDFDDESDQTTYPRKEIIDGKAHYYDDNGNLYRVENDLTPNNEYEINGYKYKTDEQGRIVSAEGTLHLKDRDGRLTIKDSIEDIGKGDQKEGDDRGHLIGDQFDGSNGLENMVPQDANINRNDFRNFENELAKAVKDGKEVTVKVEPIYDGDSRRPDAIVVTYSIDGEESVRVFPNGQED